MLTAATPVQSILIVCLGNICRSPYSESRLRIVLAEGDLDDVEVASAGFIGPGRTSPPVAQKVARARGVDLGEHRSRVLTAADLSSHDLVVVMSSDQRRRLAREFGLASTAVLVLGDVDPEPVRQRAIDDPFDQPEEVFDSVYERIDRCIAALAGALAAGQRRS